MKIALDVMGGDRGPSEILKGAVRCAELSILPASDLILVGPQDEIGTRLAELGVEPNRFAVEHASQVISMEESPVEALRRKPDNSLSRAVQLLKEGKAQATISAGHTGAAVAAAMMGLRSLEGIRRPGIAVVVEGASGPFCVIDVGANPQPKPTHLLQYGIMGTALLLHAHGVQQPRVGLMNIGAEDRKGNEFTREVHALFRRSRLNFIGNIEGNDVFGGRCDVIVTDGFVGNVMLKVSEGVGEHLMRVLREEIAGLVGDPDKVAELLARVHRHLDYTEYGGALLMGVEGISVICHGRSDAKAVANAVRVAVKAVETDVNQHIVAGVREFGRMDNAVNP